MLIPFDSGAYAISLMMPSRDYKSYSFEEMWFEKIPQRSGVIQKEIAIGEDFHISTFLERFNFIKNGKEHIEKLFPNIVIPKIVNILNQFTTHDFSNSNLQ